MPQTRPLLAGASLDLPASAAPALHRLLGYWNERRGVRRFPARAALDPLDMTYLLGWILLFDVLYDPLRFRYRLVGSHIAERDGFDMTGRMLDELPLREYREMAIAGLSTVIDAQAPTYTKRESFLGGRPYYYEVLRLPLSDDGAGIDRILTARVLAPGRRVPGVRRLSIAEFVN